MLQHRFRVPLDAEFVGFRASRPVERTIAELRLRALQVVDVDRRFESPIVRSSADFGFARVFFHDGDSYPEAEGFWVRGRSTTRLTILKPNESQTSVTLAIHSGARPNTATLATPTGRSESSWFQGVTRKIAVPSTQAEPFIPLGHQLPMDSSRRKSSRAAKTAAPGVWIAFIPDDTARTSEGR